MGNATSRQSLRLFGISRKIQEAGELLNVDWAEEVLDAKTCGYYCTFTAKNVYPAPVDLVLNRSPKSSLTWCQGPLIIRTTLLERFRTSMAHCAVGEVYVGSGASFRLEPEFKTVYTDAPWELWVRGKQGSRYIPCDECGRVVSMNKGPGYVLYDYLLDNQGVYFDCTEMFIDESLVTEFEAHAPKDLRLYGIKIVDQPQDGLPVWPRGTRGYTGT